MGGCGLEDTADGADIVPMGWIRPGWMDLAHLGQGPIESLGAVLVLVTRIPDGLVILRSFLCLARCMLMRLEKDVDPK